VLAIPENIKLMYVCLSLSLSYGDRGPDRFLKDSHYMFVSNRNLNNGRLVLHWPVVPLNRTKQKGYLVDSVKLNSNDTMRKRKYTGQAQPNKGCA